LEENEYENLQMGPVAKGAIPTFTELLKDREPSVRLNAALALVL
jgi:vesicle coat complex subunit